MMKLSPDQKAIAVIGATLIQMLKAFDHPREGRQLDEEMKGWFNEIIKEEKAKAKERDSGSFKIILPEGSTVKEIVPPQTQTQGEPI